MTSILKLNSSHTTHMSLVFAKLNSSKRIFHHLNESINCLHIINKLQKNHFHRLYSLPLNTHYKNHSHLSTFLQDKYIFLLQYSLEDHGTENISVFLQQHKINTQRQSMVNKFLNDSVSKKN